LGPFLLLLRVVRKSLPFLLLLPHWLVQSIVQMLVLLPWEWNVAIINHLLIGSHSSKHIALSFDIAIATPL
jgi:hypothetical protein